MVKTCVALNKYTSKSWPDFSSLFVFHDCYCLSTDFQWGSDQGTLSIVKPSASTSLIAPLCITTCVLDHRSVSQYMLFSDSAAFWVFFSAGMVVFSSEILLCATSEGPSHTTGCNPRSKHDQSTSMLNTWISLARLFFFKHLFFHWLFHWAGFLMVNFTVIDFPFPF